MSNVPHGSGGGAAAAAVRALGPQYKGVTAVDSGLVSVLTQHERPSEDSYESSSRRAGGVGEEAERVHEELLFGMEVHTEQEVALELCI